MKTQIKAVKEKVVETNRATVEWQQRHVVEKVAIAAVRGDKPRRSRRELGATWTTNKPATARPGAVVALPTTCQSYKGDFDVWVDSFAIGTATGMDAYAAWWGSECGGEGQ